MNWKVLLLATICASCGLNEPSLSINEIALREFNGKYNLEVENVPIIFNEFDNQYTSVVYQRGSLYRLYLNNSGVISSRRIQPTFPVGSLRVLCILRLSDALIQELDYVKSHWEEVQEEINLQFVDLSDSLGYKEPIVEFINENHYLSQLEFPAWSLSNNSVQDFRDFARQNNLNYEDYDILLFMDLDEKNPSGGSGGWESSFAKVGWFYDDVELSKEKFTGFAFAAYHHEIGHVWGWEHEWSDPYLQNGFITNLSLFGWTDLNGNGVPEILDSESYKNTSTN